MEQPTYSSAASSPPSCPFEPSQPEERLALQQLWETGRLHRHIDALERFYRSKRRDLQDEVALHSDDSKLVTLAKQLVIECGIVDQLNETLDQIREIEAEIWIQGERGNLDREKIAAEWTDRHAAKWRQWRIKEYLFATERMPSRLRHCLQVAENSA